MVGWKDLGNNGKLKTTLGNRVKRNARKNSNRVLTNANTALLRVTSLLLSRSLQGKLNLYLIVLM